MARFRRNPIGTRTVELPLTRFLSRFGRRLENRLPVRASQIPIRKFTSSLPRNFLEKNNSDARKQEIGEERSGDDEAGRTFRDVA
jgi:hypothetical protein